MYLKAIVLIAAILYDYADAAVKIDAAERVKARRIELMAKRSLNDPPPDLRTLLHLTKDEDVKKQWGMDIRKGLHKTRYMETFKGVPIYGSVITTDDKETEVTGTFYQNIDKDIDSVTPKLSHKEALAKFINHNNHQLYDISNKEVVLYIYIKDKKARLIYEIAYMATKNEKNEKPMCLMNANTGEILKQWSDLEDYYSMRGFGGNTKTGKYWYNGTKYGYLQVKGNGSSCIMENDNVTVIHMHNRYYGYYYAYNIGHCNGNNDTTSSGGYSPLNDALYFGNNVDNMFKTWYGIKPLNHKIVLRVHYGWCYDNAVWSGSYASFGDGCSMFYPLVGADIVAHEIAHGFTQQNSRLVYSGMSGGMNEAFSDMAGEAAEAFLRGQPDWKVGYDITKYGSLRYFDYPPRDGRSIQHARNYYNGMNVHYSSGIYNKAFYLLCNSSGWQMKDAFHIFLIANRLYWYQDSTFDEGACHVIQAAKDLGFNTDDVKQAFQMVGVSCYVDNSSFVELENGKAVYPLTGSSTKMYKYFIDKSNCGGNLEIKSSGGYCSGKFYLYIRLGYPVSKRNYDYVTYRYYSSYVYYNINRGCGRYYIMAFCSGSYHYDISLIASYRQKDCKTANLCPGINKVGLSGSKGSMIYYKLETSYNCNMTITSWGGEGDLDIYIRRYGTPSSTYFDLASMMPGNDEELTFTSKGSYYYILIHAYEAFGGAELSVVGHCFGPEPEDDENIRKRSLTMETDKTKGTKFENMSYEEIRAIKMSEAKRKDSSDKTKTENEE